METPDPRPPILPFYQLPSLPPYSQTVHYVNLGEEALKKTPIGNGQASHTAAESTNSTNPNPVNPTNFTDPSEILPPAVLTLAGQSIHAESDPDMPLYRANRGLASLGPATRIVVLERLERRPSRTKQRPRHIYNLFYMPSSGMPIPSSKRPEYFIQAVSSRSAPVGHLGLQESRSPFSKRWMALPVCIQGPSVSGAPPFDVDRPTIVFEARYRKGVCKWTDTHGQEVALQYETSAAGATTSPRLIVTASLHRELRDALVALWCCYVWEQSVNRHQPVPMARTKSPLIQGHMFR